MLEYALLRIFYNCIIIQKAGYQLYGASLFLCFNSEIVNDGIPVPWALICELGVRKEFRNGVCGMRLVYCNASVSQHRSPVGVKELLVLLA